jgi:hypothetical protein
VTARRYDHRTRVDPVCLRRATHGEGGDATASADRDTEIHNETGLDREADDHRSLGELGRRAEGDMESELRAISLDKEAAEDVGSSDGNKFLIHLGRCDDGWRASCILVAKPRITRTATRGTPAQALAEIARDLNRFLYGRARHRADSEDAERTIPPTSTSADER